MATKKKPQKKSRNTEKFSVRLKKVFSAHKILILILSLVMLLSGGVTLIVLGYLDYNRATREAYVVAGMKSMEDGNFHKAQSFFLKATYVGAPEAYPYLAWLSAKSGNFTKALEEASNSTGKVTS